MESKGISSMQEIESWRYQQLVNIGTRTVTDVMGRGGAGRGGGGGGGGVFGVGVSRHIHTGWKRLYILSHAGYAWSLSITMLGSLRLPAGGGQSGKSVFRILDDND